MKVLFSVLLSCTQEDWGTVSAHVIPKKVFPRRPETFDLHPDERSSKRSIGVPSASARQAVKKTSDVDHGQTTSLQHKKRSELVHKKTHGKEERDEGTFQSAPPDWDPSDVCAKVISDGTKFVTDAQNDLPVALGHAQRFDGTEVESTLTPRLGDFTDLGGTVASCIGKLEDEKLRLDGEETRLLEEEEDQKQLEADRQAAEETDEKEKERIAETLAKEAREAEVDAEELEKSSSLVVNHVTDSVNEAEAAKETAAATEAAAQQSLDAANDAANNLNTTAKALIQALRESEASTLE